MQDRFKIRCFYKGEMHDDISYQILEDYGYDTFAELSEHHTIMACTGLKDKNGKLIYEGDIVKLSDGSINGSILEFIKVVEWKTNKWNIPNWIKDDCDNTHFIEIIGNIYQDSHLLDKPKN